MPFSELFRMAKVEVDALQQRKPHLSSDHSIEGSNICAELVWDNGQITLQNQSSRAKRGPCPNNFPSFVSSRGDEKDAKNSKSNFGAMNSLANDFPLSAPPSEMGLDQDDSVVPWLTCPVVEPFSSAYCSAMLRDSFGDTRNDLSGYTGSASMGKGKGYNCISQFADASSAANGLSLIGANTPEIQQAAPKPAGSVLNGSGRGNASHVEVRNSVGSSTGMKLHTTNAGQLNNGSSLMNFSYISQLASTRTQRLGNENKESDLISHNVLESTLVNSNVGFSTQESGFHVEPSMPPSNGCQETVNPKSDSTPTQIPMAVWQEPIQKVAKSLDKQSGSAPTKVAVAGEMAPEPAVATSSVCSGNGSDRASDNPTSNLKRKSCDTGDTEGPNDEVEDESVVAGKTPVSAVSKRSRASEVHNLSERRRRDRINEKMRALQELVPNCNKADKASMLDEAIEYLRTLQHQVQILSMGSGMCITPLMFPAAMQHMHVANMPQFSPMGIGMGMGFGMGMPNVNNGMMQMSSIQGPCYPAAGPPIPSSFGYHGAAGSSQQGLGHLGQGLSTSTPDASLPFMGGFSMGLPAGNVPHMPGLANAMLSDAPRDIAPNVSSQSMFNGYANSSMNQGSNQASILLNQQPRTATAGEAQHCIGGSSTKPS